MDAKEYWEDLARTGAWSTVRLYGSRFDVTNYNCLTRRECVQDILATEGRFEKILDIGCGTGDYFTIAEEHQAAYHGIDWSWHMARGAAAKVDGRGNKHLVVVGSGATLPYASDSFDVVLAIGYIEYFADPSGPMREIRRVLKPGGVLVMQSFKRDLFGSLGRVGERLRFVYGRLLGRNGPSTYKTWPWEKQYSRRGLDRMLKRFGFAHLDHRFNNHWIYFRSLQVRWPTVNIRISETLNRLNSAWWGFLAVNYVGKYRLVKKTNAASLDAATIDDGPLTLLVCPEDKTPLRPATAAEISLVNRRIEASRLATRSGRTVPAAITQGLVRRDSRYLYPIRGEIPVLLVDEAIPLAGSME